MRSLSETEYNWLVSVLDQLINQIDEDETPD